MKSRFFLETLLISILLTGCGDDAMSDDNNSEVSIVLADRVNLTEESSTSDETAKDENTSEVISIANEVLISNEEENLTTTTNTTENNNSDENNNSEEVLAVEPTAEETNLTIETNQTISVDANESLETNNSVNENEENSIEEPQTKTLPSELISQLNVGFGGRGAYPFTQVDGESAIWISSTRLMQDDELHANSYFQNKIENFDSDKFSELQQYLSRAKYLSYWMTEHWEESWFSKTEIQKAMDAGVVPVFMYWYFGDTLTGIPSDAQLAEYYANNQKVADFLNDLNGTVLIVMEPEFNKDNILESNSTQLAFANIISQAITNIESNVSNIDPYFSLCMTDAGNRGVNSTYASCGYDNCALGDKYSWSQTETIYKALEEKISFISFQQMLAQFSRNPSNPGTWNSPNPISYTDEDLGIEYLAQRIKNLSAYLNETHNKPVFLPYMSIATATWSDNDNSGTVSDDEIDKEGWKHTPENVYEALASQKDALETSGLFGYLPMALFDNPRQDYGGYQYFMQNEYHLGLIQTSAEDETDKYIYGDLEFKGNVLEHIFGAI